MSRPWASKCAVHIDFLVCTMKWMQTQMLWKASLKSLWKGSPTFLLHFSLFWQGSVHTTLITDGEWHSWNCEIVLIEFRSLVIASRLISGSTKGEIFCGVMRRVGVMDNFSTLLYLPDLQYRCRLEGTSSTKENCAFLQPFPLHRSWLLVILAGRTSAINKTENVTNRRRVYGTIYLCNIRWIILL